LINAIHKIETFVLPTWASKRPTDRRRLEVGKGGLPPQFFAANRFEGSGGKPPLPYL